MAITREELLKVNGGGMRYSIYGVLAGLLSFVIGAVDGYLRPLKCN